MPTVTPAAQVDAYDVPGHPFALIDLDAGHVRWIVQATRGACGGQAFESTDHLVADAATRRHDWLVAAADLAQRVDGTHLDPPTLWET